MIGQQKIRGSIQSLIDTDTLGQFLIIVGPKGYGKKTLMNLIANNWRFSYICDDAKVDTIRQMIKFAYQERNKCIYIVPDLDTASTQAKNSLLKIVEEPPKGATFIISASSSFDVPATIISRGQVYAMDPYTADEKREYLAQKEDCQDNARTDFIVSVANNISDVENLRTVDLDALDKQVNVLIDKCDTLSYGNLIKSAKNLAFKAEDEGIPLRLFLLAFDYALGCRMRGHPQKWVADAIALTETALFDVGRASINKQMAYQNLLLKIRRVKEYSGDSED